MFRDGSVDAVGKFLGLGKVGKLALHPDGVTVRAIGNGTVDGAIAATLQAEVSLTGAGSIPVKVNINTQDAAGNGTGLGIALTLGLRFVRCLDLVLVHVRASVNGSDDGIIEAHEFGRGHPLILNLLQLVAKLAGLLSCNHKVIERLQIGVGGAEDKGMVARVNGGGDEVRGLGISTGNGNEIGA